MQKYYHPTSDPPPKPQSPPSVTNPIDHNPKPPADPMRDLPRTLGGLGPSPATPVLSPEAPVPPQLPGNAHTEGSQWAQVSLL